jgi:hypothetical protein
MRLRLCHASRSSWDGLSRHPDRRATPVCAWDYRNTTPLEPRYRHRSTAPAPYIRERSGHLGAFRRPWRVLVRGTDDQWPQCHERLTHLQGPTPRNARRRSHQGVASRHSPKGKECSAPQWCDRRTVSRPVSGRDGARLGRLCREGSACASRVWKRSGDVRGNRPTERPRTAPAKPRRADDRDRRRGHCARTGRRTNPQRLPVRVGPRSTPELARGPVPRSRDDKRREG